MSEHVTDIVESQSGSNLVPADQALARMTPQQIDQLVNAIDAVATARQRIIQTCLKRAEPEDFIDFDGKPYLEGEGADRVAATVGIRLGRPEIEVRRVGDDFFVDVMLDAYWPLTGASVVAIGSCSTRDKFFAGRNGESATMGRMLEYCQGNRELAAEMLCGHVKKKAVANAHSRAVCEVMGIKGLSWETLKQLGFSTESAGANVKFDGGKKAQQEQPQPATRGRKPRTQVPQATPARPCELHDVANMATGDVVEVRGYVTRTRQDHVGPNKTPKFNVEITAPDPVGGVISLKMFKWGEGPEWCISGAYLLAKVEIKEYQGKPQYCVLDMYELPAEPQQGGKDDAERPADSLLPE